ncbi:MULTISPECIES: TraR/DksA family transcriptional regulator [Streptomyces]|uniref:TraR/DksA C4-type zinc finger protein n=1 Tax=Streptomyces sudanensis TaxID=436397 RepID=A0ABY4TGA3_9ACTN|nr:MULTISPECIES: TraR/DksA C4-type zinc finger protein [Streptomyces]MCP9956666.1 TraR/DksA C4-type zinc finger protein [Streptomyces sudanensis]MCP9985878.1 TraR/DksA C4-type zinc finger protein [Streptomyces sudanensis]MCQ0002732.1 TraR/DksA C4-type zinc finger protein [Streptomyces sudanensis]URN17486.1 TraR/DksA C4-type zinc finger protein [Streptomyces sudanensis]
MTLGSADSHAAPGRLTEQEARQRLEHERESRLAQLRAVEAAGAGQQAADDLLAAQRASAREVLKEIDAAFERLADGTYGRCQGCGRPVPAERLEILPYTRHCVGCQRRTA